MITKTFDELITEALNLYVQKEYENDKEQENLNEVDFSEEHKKKMQKLFKSIK